MIENIVKNIQEEVGRGVVSIPTEIANVMHA